jgi:hypothetical protein
MHREAARAFDDYMKARAVTLPKPEAVREYPCDLCGRPCSQDATPQPPEVVELEQAYSRALLGHHWPEIEKTYAALSAALDVWGRARYGEHYAGAIAASIAVIDSWFTDRRHEMSDGDLEKIVRGCAGRYAPDALPLAP